ncbi:MAG: hypothetical protein RBU37_01865 [Myxococcota bacterium]|jgi:rubrerythrin|nr:hypothetical protein [Myxococcota bacterium]
MLKSSELLKIFDVARTVELELAACYDELASRSTDEPTRAFWSGLAQEEFNHAKLLELQQRLVRHGDTKVVAKVSFDDLMANYAAIRERIASASDPSLTVADVLRLCIDIEALARLCHADTLVSAATSSVDELFTRLSKDDAEHVARLQGQLSSKTPRL